MMIVPSDKTCDFCPRKCLRGIVSQESGLPVSKKRALFVWKRSSAIGSTYYRCPDCKHMSFLRGAYRPETCNNCPKKVPSKYGFKPKVFKVKGPDPDNQKLAYLCFREKCKQEMLAFTYKLDWCCAEHGSTANQEALLLSNYNNKLTKY